MHKDLLNRISIAFLVSIFTFSVFYGKGATSFSREKNETIPALPKSHKKGRKSDSKKISLKNDSAKLNKTDSINRDSTDTAKRKSNAIDAPVEYQAKDSIVLIMDSSHYIRMFKDGDVKYKDLNLSGYYIDLDATNNIVLSSFGLDSLKHETGFPVFKEGSNQFEMKKMKYNFKTKKAYIKDVITQQGDGYVTAQTTKKLSDNDMYMIDGKYTTCDDHEHPHFYLHLSKAKVRPKKNIVTGPANLVLEGVSLPLYIPFGYFPFKSHYASGIIMPTYGDELTRGFSLKDGGYYFAFNDYVDLAVTGEIWTLGSWGLAAQSTYRKRYRYSGNFALNYLVTKVGDKGDEDYSLSKDFKITWSHSQDSKANPFNTFSANVNFSTSSYNRNSINGIYSNDYTQNTKSSSVSFSRKFPNSPFTLTANATINQQSRDSTLSVSFPNMTLTMSDIYPFKRKEAVGNTRWYENIRLSYTGLFQNSISSVKENQFLQKSLIKDWKNGMEHEIPVSASFNLLKYITLTPSLNYTSRWYSSKINQAYDARSNSLVPVDTTYGFYRVYNYSASLSANTKLYGFFKPWKIFGNKIEQIRHVLTPSISLSWNPDFGDKKYGYYKDVYFYNPTKMSMDKLTYSPFANGIFGVPSEGKSGSLNFDLQNNLEAKIRTSNDSTKKISLIDNLGLSMSYNFMADSMKWSDLNASLRLKLTKSFTLNLQGVFDTYTYNQYGQRINVTRWQAGKGLGRLMSTGTSFSYTFNQETLDKLFGKGDKDKDKNKDDKNKNAPPTNTSGSGNPVAGNEEQTTTQSLYAKKEDTGNYDSDGYLKFSIPWNLSLSYSMSLGYNTNKFNKETREYPYKITQTLSMSGNIQPSKGWNFNFSSSYDFDQHKMAYMNCSVMRNLHCWQMSASFIPIGSYQSFYFTLAVSSSILKDLKVNKSSSYRDAVDWK